MKRRIKILLFFGIAGILLAVGTILSIFQILPIKSTSVFLMGITMLWTGVSLILKINIDLVEKYTRKIQWWLSATYTGLGIAWIVISCTPQSLSALPMIYVSTPFVLAAIFIGLRYKN